MILENKSTIILLRHLCLNPFDSFSILELSKKLNISRNWLYKNIYYLNQYNILEEKNKRFKLNFRTLFIKKLKIAFDNEFIAELEKTHYNQILEIFNGLSYKMDYKSIILIGSFAVKEFTEKSDIDFLVVAKNKEEPPLFSNCNIIQLTINEFNEKYSKGDDFIIDTLIHGKIMDDKNFFVNYFQKDLPLFSQEIIEERKEVIIKLKNRVYELLKQQELKMASEELKKLFIQKERLETIQKNKIPLTKQQMLKENKKLYKIINKKNFNKEEILNFLKEI